MSFLRYRRISSPIPTKATPRVPAGAKIHVVDLLDRKKPAKMKSVCRLARKEDIPKIEQTIQDHIQDFRRLSPISLEDAIQHQRLFVAWNVEDWKPNAKVMGLLEMQFMKNPPVSALPKIGDLQATDLFQSLENTTAMSEKSYSPTALICVGTCWNQQEADIFKTLSTIAFAHVHNQISETLIKSNMIPECLQLVCNVPTDNTFFLTLLSHGFMNLMKSVFKLSETPYIDSKLNNCFLPDSLHLESFHAHHLSDQDSPPNVTPSEYEHVFCEPWLTRGIACLLTYEISQKKSIPVP